MNSQAHIPVLLNEVVQALNLSQSKILVDATYGRGGHSQAILNNLARDGRLIVIDQDADAIADASSKFAAEQRIEIIHATFSELGEILRARELIGKVDGILFDFGVCSTQLDVSERGFSFRNSGPLDMRMNQTQGASAEKWIREVEEKELIRVLRVYGEERFAKRIARKIKQVLLDGNISSTADLTRIVCQVVPNTEKNKHPATRTFQAIRIAVNDELSEIEKVLPQALEALSPGGRLVVISFHSLEDRIVKQYFRFEAKGDPYPADLAVTYDMLKPQLQLVGKPIKASYQELLRNPRARSAVMRVAQKVA